MKNNLNMILLMVVLLVVGIFVGQKINTSHEKIGDIQQVAATGAKNIIPKYTERQLSNLGATLNTAKTQEVQSAYNGAKVNITPDPSGLYTYNCYGFNIQGQGMYQQWVSSVDLGVGFTISVFNGSSTLYCSLQMAQ